MGAACVTCPSQVQILTLFPRTTVTLMNTNPNHPAMPPAPLYPPPGYQQVSGGYPPAAQVGFSYDTRINIEEVPPHVSPQTGRPQEANSMGRSIASRMAGGAGIIGGATMVYHGVQLMTSEATQGSGQNGRCTYADDPECINSQHTGIGLIAGGVVATIAGIAAAFPKSRKLIASCLEACGNSGGCCC